MVDNPGDRRDYFISAVWSASGAAIALNSWRYAPGDNRVRIIDLASREVGDLWPFDSLEQEVSVVARYWEGDSAVVCSPWRVDDEGTDAAFWRVCPATGNWRPLDSAELRADLRPQFRVREHGGLLTVESLGVRLHEFRPQPDGWLEGVSLSPDGCWIAYVHHSLEGQLPRARLVKRDGSDDRPRGDPFAWLGGHDVLLIPGRRDGR